MVSTVYASPDRVAAGVPGERRFPLPDVRPPNFPPEVRPPVSPPEFRPPISPPERQVPQPPIQIPPRRGF